MKLAIVCAAAAAALTVIGVVLAAPWTSPPQLVYDTVAGYPMLVYYHNIGGEPAETSGFGGVPAVSVGAPLPVEKLDAFFAEAKKRVVPAPDLVKPGERVRFVLDDPNGLAWVAAKEEKPTYFYVIAVLESPRSSFAVGRRWVNELCLVAKTGERFKRCSTHNGVYADS